MDNSNLKIINNADYKQMQRIIYVEKPFHKFVSFCIIASFSVIHHQKRDCQYNSCMNYSVNFIKCKEIYNSINEHIKKHPKHLSIKLSSVSSYRKHTQTCNTAPITRETHNTNQKYKKYSRLRNFFFHNQKIIIYKTM